MVSAEQQRRDAFEYLVPQARGVARWAARKYGTEFDELYPVALTGAWLAAGAYDAERSASLWRYAGTFIRRFLVDEYRNEFGRAGSGRSAMRDATQSVGLFQESPGGLAEDGGDVWASAVGVAEPGFGEVEDRDAVAFLRRELSRKHWDILEHTVIGDMSLSEWGARWGVGESRACNVRRAALESARELLAA